MYIYIYDIQYYTIIYLNNSKYFFIAYMNECQISSTFLPAAGREDGVDYSVSLSFIEVYKEVGYDLLSKARREIWATSWSWISLSIPVIQVGLGEKVDLKYYQTLSAVCETCFQNGKIFWPPAFVDRFGRAYAVLWNFRCRMFWHRTLAETRPVLGLGNALHRWACIILLCKQTNLLCKQTPNSVCYTSWSSQRYEGIFCVTKFISSFVLVRPPPPKSSDNDTDLYFETEWCYVMSISFFGILTNPKHLGIFARTPGPLSACPYRVARLFCKADGPICIKYRSRNCTTSILGI